MAEKVYPIRAIRVGEIRVSFYGYKKCNDLSEEVGIKVAVFFLSNMHARYKDSCE
jgi:hypothetical protein